MGEAHLDIIIPTRNAPSALDLTLRSLAIVHPPDEGWTVVVVDDASDPPVAEVARTFESALPLRYVQLTSRRGRGGARNAGVAETQGGRLWFIDGDSVVSAEAMARYSEACARREDKIMVGPRHEVNVEQLSRYWRAGVVSQDAADWREMYGLVTADGAAQYPLAEWVLVSTCNLFMPRVLFESVGGFDEGLLGWGLEDMELGYRAVRALGGSPGCVLYEHDAFTLHIPEVKPWAELTNEETVNYEYIRAKHKTFEWEALRCDDFVQSSWAIDKYSRCCKEVERDRVGVVVLPELWVLFEAATSIVLSGPAVGIPADVAKKIVLRLDVRERGAASLRLFGMWIPLGDDSADAAVFIDDWRVLSALDFGRMVREGLRVARRVIVVASQGAREGAGEGVDELLGIVFENGVEGSIVTEIGCAGTAACVELRRW